MTDTIEKKAKEKIEAFHYYIKELGLEKAKKKILENTVILSVREYINNY